MKEESAIATAPAPDAKPRVEARPRSRKSTRRGDTASPLTHAGRFFLSKGEGNGVPLLDREFKTEGEAMIESLKSGKSYFVVLEWRGTADFSKKVPQIRKESVSAKHS